MLLAFGVVDSLTFFMAWHELSSLNSPINFIPEAGKAKYYTLSLICEVIGGESLSEDSYRVKEVAAFKQEPRCISFI